MHAFRGAVVDGRGISERFAQRKQRHAWELLAWVWLPWRSLAAWQGKLLRFEKSFRRRRSEFGVGRWQLLVAQRNRGRHLEVVASRHRQRRTTQSLCRAIGWWEQHFRRRRCVRRRGETVSGRYRIVLVRAVFALWDEVVRASVRAECSRLSAEVDRVAQSIKCRQDQREGLQQVASERAAAHQDLLEEIDRREAEAALTEARTQALQAESAELLIQLEAEREVKVPVQAEIDGLQAALANRRQRGDPELAALEVQLVEAIEVQGSLRYALRRAQHDAERVAEQRTASQARAAELRQNLEQARTSYIYAIDALDRKVAGLERESEEAERMTEGLEQALEATAFKMRLADVELQRWLT